MRGAAVVVGTVPVLVLRMRAVGAGVAVATDDVVASEVGRNGAAGFWTCVAANALMPVKLVKVMPATIARSANAERIGGVGFAAGPFIGLDDHGGAAAA